MTDVFISYKREDQARVQRLYDGLSRVGLSVWWDLDTEGGTAWRQRIEQHLDESRCVIVVWSRMSVGEQGTWVFEEAGRALRRGVLLPVKMDAVSPPLGFGECQALDLVGWNGNEKDQRFQDVLASTRAIVARLPRPRPTYRRRIIALSTVGLAMVAVAVALLFQPALHRAVCAVPGIRRLCNRPDDCFKWGTRQRRHVLYVRAGEQPFPTEATAQAATLRQAPAEAKLVCSGAEGSLIGLEAADVEVKDWKCDQRQDGYRCSLDGVAICKQKERVAARAGECEP